MPRDYVSNTVEDAAAFQAHYHGDDEPQDEPSYSRADAEADAAIMRDDDDLFEIDNAGNCTMCNGAKYFTNCPGRCSHENCSEGECPQCEGEGHREEKDLLPEPE